MESIQAYTNNKLESDENIWNTITMQTISIKNSYFKLQFFTWSYNYFQRIVGIKSLAFKIVLLMVIR